MSDFTCLALYQRDGSMNCTRCGLSWDYSDRDDKPDCLTPQAIAHGTIDKMLSDSDQPPVFKRINFDNGSLIVQFTLGKFQGVNLGAGESITNVVDKLRSLATLIERGVK